MFTNSLTNITDAIWSSFAFVEYEDRRDADDAYYEMHNKRLGRDDILKIEVRPTNPSSRAWDLPANEYYTVGSHSSFGLLAVRLWSRP